MDIQSSRKTYGDIQIDGSPHVLIGDQNVSNHYHVNFGAVSLYLKPTKRLAVGTASGISNRSRATKAERRAHRALGRARHAAVEKEQNDRTRHKFHEITAHDRAISRPDSRQYEQMKQLLVFLYERFRYLPFIPRIPITVIPVERGRGEESAFGVRNAPGEELIQNTGWSVSPAGRDLLILSAASLSLVLGRNLSTQDILRLLLRCQQDQLIPLLTFLLGFGLYRYLALSSPTARPATQYFLTLEDAYGRSRPLAMDVCVDFSVLRQFLQVHYRQTNGVAGEALVRAGQFHLLLGSRRGRLVETEEWSTPGCIKKGSRIVNSVFVSVNDTKCPSCSTTFTITDNGNFRCESCQTYHRDCDKLFPPLNTKLRRTEAAQELSLSAFSDSPKISREVGASTSQAPRMETRAARGNANSQDTGQVGFAQYMITGLKNVDIRIVADDPASDESAFIWPLRWAQEVFKPSSRPFSKSRISCHDLQDTPNVRPSHPRYEVLRLSFMHGLDLRFDCETTTGHLSLCLIRTGLESGDVELTSHLLSNLVMRQPGSSLTVWHHSRSGKVAPWISIMDIPSRESMVLLYCVFVALRSQDTSTEFCRRVTNAILEEVEVFTTSLIDRPEGSQAICLYHDIPANRLRLVATRLTRMFGWVPIWTALFSMPLQRRWHLHPWNEQNFVFRLSSFRNHKVHSFSMKYKVPLTEDGALVLTLDDELEAEDLYNVLNDLHIHYNHTGSADQ